MMLFQEKAPRIMVRLMQEFALSKQSAAAILGNLGHESAGFTLMQEVKPGNGGRGGYGWAQWTGPRRRAFEAYCEQRNLEPYFDEANLGFLVEELRTTHQSALRGLNDCPSLMAAVQHFERHFERADPRFKHYDRRLQWANRALQAFAEFAELPAPVLKPKSD